MDDVNKSGAAEKPTFDLTKQTWKDDVTFIVEDKRLYASKAVLALFSPVFESMFGSNFKEKDANEIPLPGKKFDDVLEFLHCLYPNSNKYVTEKNVLKVLPLADEYTVLPLLKKCKKTLNNYIRNIDGNLSLSELVECYNSAARHRLSEEKHLSVEMIINRNDLEVTSAESEQIMDEDTLLEFKNDIIAQQAERLDNITTKFVKLYLTTPKTARSISGFENAKGAIIEHRIVNVLDPSVQGTVSKPVKIWNASFTVLISVSKQSNNEQSEKFLSAYLCCSLPGDKWSCDVKADLVLENVLAAKNQIIAKEDISDVFKSPDTLSWGYENFGKLSMFLTGTPEHVKNYTGKVVAYILAKKPVEDKEEI